MIMRLSDTNSWKKRSLISHYNKCVFVHPECGDQSVE